MSLTSGQLHARRNPMQVTISFLPVPLSLVRIPRSRLSKLTHPILRQILKPSPTFLSITCNQLELSIFAERDMLEDFEHIAKRDRRKRQARVNMPRDRNLSSQADEYESIEISYDTWNVLQIDSHSNGLDSSGARIHELSAPLAAAGISILYLSSYMSDFIFVKSTRIKGVMSLMAAAGFDLYSSDFTHLTSTISPLLSPTSTDDSLSILDISAEFGSPTVITRSRSSTDSSLASMLLGTSMNDPSDSSEDDNVSVGSGSNSPTPSGVTILNPTLTSIGLSDDHADTWTLKIVKLVSFPDLICSSCIRNQAGQKCSPSHSPRSLSFEFDCQPLTDGILTPSDSSDDEHDDDDDEQQEQSPRSGNRNCRPKQTRDCQVSFYSFTRTSEGSSLTTDVKLLAALFPPNERDMVICSDELNNADSLLSNGPLLPDLEELEEDTEEEEDVKGDEDQDPNGGDDSSRRVLSGTMKCLQIDLRKFGLDKYGVVTRFSKLLQEHGINHMYSSTFKTANLLVDKTYARRARELLLTC